MSPFPVFALHKVCVELRLGSSSFFVVLFYKKTRFGAVLGANDGVRQVDENETEVSRLVGQLERATRRWKRGHVKKVLHVLVQWLRSQLEHLRACFAPPNAFKKAADGHAHHESIHRSVALHNVLVVSRPDGGMFSFN